MSVTDEGTERRDEARRLVRAGWLKLAWAQPFVTVLVAFLALQDGSLAAGVFVGMAVAFLGPPMVVLVGYGLAQVVRGWWAGRTLPS